MEKVTADEIYYDKLITGNEINFDTSQLKMCDEFFIYCRNVLVGVGHISKENTIKINKLLV